MIASIGSAAVASRSIITVVAGLEVNSFSNCSKVLTTEMDAPIELAVAVIFEENIRSETRAIVCDDMDSYSGLTLRIS